MAIRVRPLNQKESNSGEWDVVRTQDNLIVHLHEMIDNFRSNIKIVRNGEQEDVGCVA